MTTITMCTQYLLGKGVFSKKEEKNPNEGHVNKIKEGC